MLAFRNIIETKMFAQSVIPKLIHSSSSTQIIICVRNLYNKNEIVILVVIA